MIKFDLEYLARVAQLPMSSAWQLRQAAPEMYSVHDTWNRSFVTSLNIRALAHRSRFMLEPTEEIVIEKVDGEDLWERLFRILFWTDVLLKCGPNTVEDTKGRLLSLEEMEAGLAALNIDTHLLEYLSLSGLEKELLQDVLKCDIPLVDSLESISQQHSRFCVHIEASLRSESIDNADLFNWTNNLYRQMAVCLLSLGMDSVVEKYLG